MIRTYTCPIFKVRVTFIKTDKLKELISWVETEMNPADKQLTASLLEKSNAFTLAYQKPDMPNNRFLLCVCQDEIDQSLLVHELMHLVHFIFHELDTPLSLDTKELYGYYMEYWHKKLIKFLKAK